LDALEGEGEVSHEGPEGRDRGIRAQGRRRRGRGAGVRRALGRGDAAKGALGKTNEPQIKINRHLLFQLLL